MKTLSRLQPGMVVRISGEAHRVVMVNDCRARVVPVTKLNARKQFVEPTGRKRDFVATRTREGISISPNAEVEIVEQEGAESGVSQKVTKGTKL